MKKYKGVFVDIDGMDGAGKTTQIKLIEQFYTEHNIPHFITKEPSIGEFGVLLRRLLKEPSTDPVIDALMFAVDRIDHCNREIIPHLEKGELVISDRYLFSSLAYQSIQLKEKYNDQYLDWIMAINRFCVMPDLVIYLDIKPETSMERKAKIQELSDAEKFENLAFQQKLNVQYNRISKSALLLKSNVVMINGEESVENVNKKIISKIDCIMAICAREKSNGRSQR